MGPDDKSPLSGGRGGGGGGKGPAAGGGGGGRAGVGVPLSFLSERSVVAGTRPLCINAAAHFSAAFI